MSCFEDFYILFFQQLSLKLIDFCTIGSAPSPCSQNVLLRISGTYILMLFGASIKEKHVCLHFSSQYMLPVSLVICTA